MLALASGENRAIWLCGMVFLDGDDNDGYRQQYILAVASNSYSVSAVVLSASVKYINTSLSATLFTRLAQKVRV